MHELIAQYALAIKESYALRELLKRPEFQLYAGYVSSLDYQEVINLAAHMIARHYAEESLDSNATP
jgi:hypothetical protein